MIKLSHSGLTTYQICPKKYQLQYIEKLVPSEINSPLIFGSALDNSFNEILLNIKKLSPEKLIKLGIEVFNKHWSEKEDKYQGKIKLDTNPNVVYSKKDFDVDILTEQDYMQIEQTFQFYKLSLKGSPGFTFESGVDLFNAIRENLQDFQQYEDSVKSFYNHVNWLSMRRKAEYMIKAYVQDLLPYIEEVVDIQVDLTTKDEAGNTLVGVGDFTVKLKAGQYGNIIVSAEEIIIADNKSSGSLYKQDSVATSAQLATYKVILNERGENIKKGAYFVILKDLKKVQNKTCKSCGHKIISSHKKCNAVIDKKRCDGEWSVELDISASTQLIVDNISEEMQINAMNDFDNVIQSIKDKKFEENYEACKFQFGKPCPYIGMCHSGSTKGLIKQGNK